MRRCSVTRQLEIVEGGMADYQRLSVYHYLGGGLAGYDSIFALRGTGALRRRIGGSPAGVIVYKMPAPSVELRNAATGNFFVGFDRATQMELVNKNVRCIGRLIIEPRFRGLGLASRLVRETIERMDFPVIEAIAVMGAVVPFFEKAGMTAYRAPMPARCVQLIEALSLVGIEEREFVEPVKVHRKIERLEHKKRAFIEKQIRDFMERYGQRRHMPAGFERTRYALGKLTARPVYYIYKKQGIRVSGGLKLKIKKQK